ncbi:MAG: galactokinase [Streptococcaceae bacterium]|jgi:galactokinase|nr:galactokinase [Streptococcaceae bacterium]
MNIVTNSAHLSALTEKFDAIFGDHASVDYFFSPGRVNLIGEHTDYNGGYVFPASITIGTTGLARKRTDKRVRLYSLNFEAMGVIEFDVSDLTKISGNWANYVKGMISVMRAAGYTIDSGFELLVQGEIPTASGLSSSASLELLVGIMLEDLFSLDVTRLELVKFGKQTENEFIGVNSGIMDQFAIGFGEIGKAILLDCNTLNYELVPAEFGDNVVVIMNTKKPHDLVDSKYNERVAETQEALKRLQVGGLKISTLGELTNEEFEANTQLIGDETLIKRARHAVHENQRTKEAKAALTAGNLEAFGKMLNASHASLKNDYEVTGIELDTLAETAQSVPGVLGARMTGGGFGGCAIALVKKSEVDALIATVGKTYEEKIGYPAEFYVASIGAGATKLDVD